MTAQSNTHPSPTQPAEKELDFFETALHGWNRFWFTPADPTILALIRICCGLLTVYTLFAYTQDLEAFFGRDAWLNLNLRLKTVQETPWNAGPLNWSVNTPPNGPVAQTPEQKRYVELYTKKWGSPPPLPFPKNDAEVEYINKFRAYWGQDPRTAFALGNYEWSLFFHITDPNSILALHWVFILVAIMLTLGLATRVTSVLTWFAFLSYIHRSPVTLFGVDTMNLILLMYLMVGPCGAAISLDRLIARWWYREGANKFQGFFTKMFRRGTPTSEQTILVADQTRWPFVLEPAISANIAIRCLQIHLCFIYGAAGLSKLQGNAWWMGTAVWSTLTNPEFAPMYSDFYMGTLRRLCSNQLIINLVLAAGTWLTLIFEICYPFLIWNRHTRWLMLTMAIFLHGFIALFMGLKTFALMMLVLNMAFLPRHSVDWLLSLFRRQGNKSPQKSPPESRSALASKVRPTVIQPPPQPVSTPAFSGKRKK